MTNFVANYASITLKLLQFHLKISKSKTIITGVKDSLEKNAFANILDPIIKVKRLNIPPTNMSRFNKFSNAPKFEVFNIFLYR